MTWNHLVKKHAADELVKYGYMFHSYNSSDMLKLQFSQHLCPATKILCCSTRVLCRVGVTLCCDYIHSEVAIHAFSIWLLCSFTMYHITFCHCRLVYYKTFILWNDLIYIILHCIAKIRAHWVETRSITLDIFTRLLDNAAFVCIHVVGRFSEDFSEVRGLRSRGLQLQVEWMTTVVCAELWREV